MYKRQIENRNLRNGAVRTSTILDGSVTQSKLADGAVTSTKIADGAVEGDHLSSGIGPALRDALGRLTGVARFMANKVGLSNANFGGNIPNTVTDVQAALDAVDDMEIDTAHLEDGAVTSSKIASSQVTSSKIADDAVTSSKLAPNAVDSDALQTGGQKSVVSKIIAGLEAQSQANKLEARSIRLDTTLFGRHLNSDINDVQLLARAVDQLGASTVNPGSSLNPGKAKGEGDLPSDTAPYTLKDLWLVPGDGWYAIADSTTTSATLSLAGAVATEDKSGEYTILLNSYLAGNNTGHLRTENDVIWLETSLNVFGRDGASLVISNHTYNFEYSSSDTTTDYFFARTSGYAWTTTALPAGAVLHSNSTKPFTVTGKVWSRVLHQVSYITKTQLPLRVVDGQLTLTADNLNQVPSELNYGDLILLWDVDNHDWRVMTFTDVRDRASQPPAERNASQVLAMYPFARRRRIIASEPFQIPNPEQVTALQAQPTLRTMSLNTDFVNGVRGFAPNYAGTDATILRNRVVFVTHGNPPADAPTATHLIMDSGLTGTPTEYAIASSPIPGEQHIYLVTGRAYSDLVAGAQYYINIKYSDGSYLYPPTDYIAGDYYAISETELRLNRQSALPFAGQRNHDGTIKVPENFLPFVTADFAKEGFTGELPSNITIPRTTDVIIHQGGLSGVATSNSSLSGYPAATTFDPAFNVTDTNKLNGEYIIDYELAVSSSFAQTAAFNQAGQVADAIKTVNHESIRFASTVRSSIAFQNGHSNGVTIADHIIYNGSATLAIAHVLLAKSSANRLLAYVWIEGVSGSADLTLYFNYFNIGFNHGDPGTSSGGSGGTLSAGSVTNEFLADSAVSTQKINDRAVTSAKLDNNAVTQQKLQTNAVTSSKIEDGAVLTGKIADDAVTNLSLIHI